MPSQGSPVSVSLCELEKGIEDKRLSDAFGPNSLGILVVENLPIWFQDLRLRVLKAASILANLPSDILKNLECEEAMWVVGWSCGKEILANTGEPDFNKGSYYINCAFHVDEKLEGPTEELIRQFPECKSYTLPNMWPADDIKGLETFKSDCKKLCNFIIDVAESVAANCDRYIKDIHREYETGYLQRIVKNSSCTKARLLHYFPSKGGNIGEDDWCGEHVDHSCLTGLTSALFLDESKGITSSLSKSPDPSAGLYIRDRNNEIVKVDIPSNSLAFQSGSALEEISRGKFKAVPHFVKGTNLPSIARNTLAVFCQPNLDEAINEKENFAVYANRILKENH
ncbi:uncharacterized protein J8A68_002683 [[Candida] subhashii]|uniref:Isopenicillin N synthase-like Fe(2+) 2OG dioxygenase domain-containing protein n=1 Tax=[Candida] subhashii TaxID=561895 RepID=A0A8J5QKJ0_9ASCO|nr:uncharacterized protein J8A68_002683 [[Candida] subhashii]KAG7663823.1 hypothetical protein J8A68_002683 [[Candida] subhashii]